jgi:hypothetical protein
MAYSVESLYLNEFNYPFYLVLCNNAFLIDCCSKKN